MASYHHSHTCSSHATIRSFVHCAALHVLGTVKTAFKDSVQAVLQPPTTTNSSNNNQQQQQQQQQPYAAPSILSIIPAACAQAAGLAGSSMQFVHPGTLMGPAEVQLLQQRASGAAAADDTWRQVGQDVC
jgi:hypothetical protein